MAPAGVTHENHRRLASFVVILALILEMQDPRFAGGLRVNVAIFAGLSYLLLLARLRALQQNLWVLGKWPMIALLAYVGWCLLSAVWSRDPAGSLQDSSLLVLGLILAVCVADVPLAEFARQFVRVAVSIAAISWLMVPIVPHLAALPDVVWRLNGPMGHPQRLALLTGAAILVLVVIRWSGQAYSRTNERDYGALFLLVATLLATQARANTAFVVVVLGAMYYARARPWQKPLLLGAGGVSIWLVLVNFGNLMGQVDREGSNTATLTGRTTIWEASITLIKEQPWVGYGFDSFGSDLTSYFFLNYVAPHAHNMWINAAFETGVIGATLLTLFLVGAVALRPRGTTRHYVWPTTVFCMLCGLTGVVYGGKLGTLWIVVTVMTAQALVERNEKAIGGRGENNHGTAPRRVSYSARRT